MGFNSAFKGLKVKFGYACSPFAVKERILCLNLNSSLSDRTVPRTRSVIWALKKKGKAIPLQAWTGPEGSRRLRFPDFKTIGT